MLRIHVDDEKRVSLQDPVSQKSKKLEWSPLASVLKHVRTGILRDTYVTVTVRVRPFAESALPS